MNVVGYGGGTDSTAMLIGLWKNHIPVDLILFADPGGEQPHTYAYLEIMDRWLKEHDMPPITRVWYQEKSGQRLTLEQECLRSGTLPSIAYGRKSCSLKHKVAPQERFCNQYQPCLDTTPVFLFFKKKTAALISQNRRQATVLCQGAWMTSRRNNGFFIIPCFAAYRFIARSYDYILAFLMHSRL